ncbi:MAG TPA: carbon starvation CstA 5TM domain-containing protein, partial [Prolixibacteraceae bacterium]|nr:carbon starvation CstA 5TM domain-containing protein [Prolixibacteraceae bacterium]
SFLVVLAWGYFIYTGTVSTIWPMFGVANQLLATLALAIGTSYLINHGKRKYIWITVVPMTFVGITTITGGVMNLFNIYIPQILNESSRAPGLVNAILTTVILICVTLILIEAVSKWIKHSPQENSYNEKNR